MTSAKPLLFVTVGLLLLTGVLLWSSLQETKEGFQSSTYTVRDLEINSCPIYAPEIQTAKGSTDCCTGDLIDGKCNGSTFCTKSPAYAGVKACTEAWREYFEKKGNDLCPGTMRNYYEDVTTTGSEKGCSASAIESNGARPTNPLDKRCKIYASEEENRTKKDSCYIEKFRSRIQCPVVNGNSPDAEVISLYRETDLGFRCFYPFELGMPQFCFEKTFLIALLDRLFSWWRTRDQEQVNALLCDNYLATREKARDQANKMQAEQRAREAADAQRRAAEEARARAEAEVQRRKEEASRLQQQLDEANRQLKTCKR